MNCLLCQEAVTQAFRFTDLFFLKKQEATICSSCRSAFKKISDQHCPSCFKEGCDQVCSDCLYWQEQGCPVSHHSIYRYNAAMKDYFSRYKFEGDYLLRTVFSQEINQALKNYQGYTLVPVPLSHEGLAKRRFNQVTGFLDHAKIPYQNLLGKEDSVKQSSKTRQERLATSQTFYLKTGQFLPEKVLLFDDIYTTGATLNLIKQLLYDAGVKDIKTLSLAR